MADSKQERSGPGYKAGISKAGRNNRGGRNANIATNHASMEPKMPELWCSSRRILRSTSIEKSSEAKNSARLSLKNFEYETG